MATLSQDPILNHIVNRLKTKYGCHTVLLYGSRARGDATAISDYDVMGVSNRAKRVTREARKFRGNYLDLFIYPTSKLKKPDSSHLYMREGTVLFEKNGFGTSLLKKLDKVFRKGPKRLPTDEIQVKRVWADKMFERSCHSDLEARYRRIWLIQALLEDYFVLRGQWFQGSKSALKWLKQNDKKTHDLFARLLHNPRSNQALKKLISRAVV